MAKNKVNNILVVLIIMFSIIASGYGFFSNKIVYEDKMFQSIDGENVTLYGKGLYYNDSISVASQAKAQDIVTLIIGVPLLIVSLILLDLFDNPVGCLTSLAVFQAKALQNRVF